MSGISEVVSKPYAEPITLAIKPRFAAVQPPKKKPTKNDSYTGPKKTLKALSLGTKPGVIAAKTEPKIEKAETEAEKARLEFEKLDKSAKAAQALGSPNAKFFVAKALVAKNVYLQKCHAIEVAKKHAHVGGKAFKASPSNKNLAPQGEELTGPSGATLAKNHYSLSAGKKEVA